MSYATDVLAHYNGAGGDLRKRLAAVLDEAEKAQAAAPKPSASKLNPDISKGAMASERAEWARADKAFAASTTLDADTILASEGRRIAETEGMRLDEAQDAAFARYPLTRQRWAEGR